MGNPISPGQGFQGSTLDIDGNANIGGDVNVSNNAVVGKTFKTTQIQIGNPGVIVPRVGLASQGQIQSADKLFAGTDAALPQSSVGLYMGSGLPNNANGNNGDFYLRASGGASTNIYQKIAGVWTEITVGGGAPAYPLLAPDGTVGAPSYSWLNDHDGGLYRAGDGDFRYAVEGADGWQLTVSGFTVSAGQAFTPDGAVGAPAYSFTSKTNTGLYRIDRPTISILQSYPLTVLGDSPIAYWRLDEVPNSGTVMADQTASAHAGIYAGTSSSVPGAICADADTAVQWGANNFAIVRDSDGNYSGAPTLNIQTGSWEAWAQVHTLPGVGSASVILANGTGAGNQGYILNIDHTGIPAAYIRVAGNYYNVNGLAAMSLDTWYHFVGTYDGATLKFYVNGVLQGSQAIAGVIEHAFAQLTIGTSAFAPGTQQNLVGKTDEAAVYNTVLSASQVLTHYQAAICVNQVRLSISGADIWRADSTGLLVLGNVRTKDKIYSGTDAAAQQDSVGLYMGSGTPSNANGSDGDFFLKSNGAVYNRQSGVWVLVAGTGLPVTFPLLAPDGSAAAPSYSWSNDTDDGLYRAGAADYRWSAAGTDIIRISDTILELFAAATGGIKVNVNAGNSGFSMYQGGTLVGTMASSGAGGNAAFTAGPAKDFTFATDAGENARFHGNNGNATFQFGLGVGSALSSAALDAQLESRMDGAGIQITLALSNNQAAAADVGTELAWFGSGKRQAAIDGAWSGAATTDAYLAFSTRQNDSLTETMRINNKGHVGIGTSAPAASALVEMASTTGALLIPRMTTTQKNALTPVNGMLVYDSTLNKFQGYENGAWANLI